MKIHRVAQGECMASIAKAHGYVDWQAVYWAPCNHGLRELRPNPHILREGDEVHLPDVSGRTIEIAAGTATTIEVSKAPDGAFCRIRVEDVAGVALAGCAYSLNLGDRVVAGHLNADAELVEAIAPDQAPAELVVTDASAVVFRAMLYFGYLDPIDTIAGVRGRLTNLGFGCGAISDEIDADLEKALRWFQEVFGLVVDGQPNEATRAELVRQFGA